jgi:hypothetical protein
MPLIIRQGDIIFEKLSDHERENKIIRMKRNNYDLDYDLEEIKSNIVAYGEATGHKHEFVSGQVSLFKTRYYLNNNTIIKIDSDYATLSHEQHLPVQIPHGIYKIVKERSYDPFAKKAEVVID